MEEGYSVTMRVQYLPVSEKVDTYGALILYYIYADHLLKRYVLFHLFQVCIPVNKITYTHTFMHISN